jgi:hypothetical protein
MISTNTIKFLCLANKEGLESSRKKVSEDKDSKSDTVQNNNGTMTSEELKNAIINEEISSEENFDNQDLSQGLKMENKRSEVIVLFNGRPPTRELGQKSLSMKTKMDPADIYGRGDIILYDNGLQRKEEGQDKSDDVNNGLELTPDEQAERVNLFLLGFVSIILMNAMAVLIIVLVKVSKYEDQLVIKSNIMKKQLKGK